MVYPQVLHIWGSTVIICNQTEKQIQISCVGMIKICLFLKDISLHINNDSNITLILEDGLPAKSVMGIMKYLTKVGLTIQQETVLEAVVKPSIIRCYIVQY